MSRLVDQMKKALESSLPSDQVRSWRWLKLIAGGEADILELRAHFPSEKPVVALIQIKLIRVEGTRVFAENWKEGSRSEITTTTRVYEKKKPIRTKVKVITDKSKPSPEHKPRKKKSRPVPDRTPARRTKKRSSTAPAKRGKLAGLSGRDRLRAAFTSPKAMGAKEAIEDGIAWVFRRYNEGRKRHGARSLPATQRARYRGKWREVAKYVLENDVRIDDFIDYAYKRTRWQKTAFPSPSVLGGPWFLGEWETREDKPRSRHAGHSYIEPTEAGGLHERLTAAGFDVSDLDDDDVAFVAEQAEALRTHPEHYSPDPDWHPFVEWAAANPIAD